MSDPVSKTDEPHEHECAHEWIDDCYKTCCICECGASRKPPSSKWRLANPLLPLSSGQKMTAEQQKNLGGNSESQQQSSRARRPCDSCGALMEEGNDTADFCDACAQKFKRRLLNARTHCFFCGHSLHETAVVTATPPVRQPQKMTPEELESMRQEIARLTALETRLFQMIAMGDEITVEAFTDLAEPDTDAARVERRERAEKNVSPWAVGGTSDLASPATLPGAFTDEMVKTALRDSAIETLRLNPND